MHDSDVGRTILWYAGMFSAIFGSTMAGGLWVGLAAVGAVLLLTSLSKAGGPS